MAAAAPLDAPSAVSRGDWCTRPKGMNVAAAEAEAAVAVAAATLLPGECWAACVGFAGTFCLSLCALSSLFTPLSSVFCFVLCFCCFWVVALGDSACEALSQSALSPSPPSSCLPCLPVCALSLSPFLSLLLSLAPLPFCLRASAVRLFVASVLWHARTGSAAAALWANRRAKSVSQLPTLQAQGYPRPHRPRCPRRVKV